MEEWRLGKAAWHNIQKYGTATWHEWSCDRWGTKWNAYECYGDLGALYFQTAWSAPHPIINKLSETFPDLEFIHEWADEDIGSNCGRMTYFGGERTEEYYPETNKEALEFAAYIWDYDLNDLGWVLNKSGTDYIHTELEEYQLIELFGKPALFSNERVTENHIPQGFYCYDIRESDDGKFFATIESKVTVNHGGSIITKKPIDLGKQGFIFFTDETQPNFIGKDISMKEYMSGEFEIEA